MESVGIRELKTHLSRYLVEVKQGKEILITERGQGIAILSPLTPEYQWMLKLVQTGKAHGRGGKPKGCRGIRLQGESMSETVMQEREAGW